MVKQEELRRVAPRVVPSYTMSDCKLKLPCIHFLKPFEGSLCDLLFEFFLNFIFLKLDNINLSMLTHFFDRFF